MEKYNADNFRHDVMKINITILLFFLFQQLCATSIANDNDYVVIYKSNEEFEYTVENVSNAIIARGMIISNTVNLSDMLNRTGKDLGYEKLIYKNAKTLEFCNANLSHRLSLADPRNVVVCPFAISIYELTSNPSDVYIIHRRYELLGDATDLNQDIQKLLKEIIEESLEF